MNIRYTVVCTLKDADVVDNYLIWLKDSHIKDVIALGGALSAEVLVKDVAEGEDPVIESCYLFPSRECLETYFNGAAGPLREDMKRLYLDTGLVEDEYSHTVEENYLSIHWAAFKSDAE